MGSSVVIALPVMGRDLGMNAITLGWVNTAYLLAAAAFLVPLGRLADLRGRKRVFLIGLAVFTVTSLALAAVPNASTLIALRVVQGVGATGMFATGMAIVTSVYPREERGRVFGIVIASVYLGLSAGPFAGGIITDYLGWRGLFVINGMIGTAVVILTVWKLKGEWSSGEIARFDSVGAVLYVVALGAILYSVSSVTDWWAWVLLAAGVFAGFLFLRRQQTLTAPLLQLAGFRGNTAFIFSNLAALINYSATFALAFLLSLYLQYIKGLSPQQAGVVMIAQPVVMAAFSPMAGKLSDRIEPRVVSSLGMGLAAVGLFLFAFLSSSTGLPFIIASLMILGFGFALFSSPNTNAVMSSVGREHFGTASAVLGTMRLTGHTLSMAAATLILLAFVGRRPITIEVQSQFLQATRVAFASFAALCTVGVLFSLARGKMR
ncbi:MFS transporter [bacterium]|nr:MFS transporter [bacterium]MBU1985311.1 MFS transporter [bacterium]